LTIASINCTVVRNATTRSINTTAVNEASASDCIVTITSINVTFIVNAILGSYDVVIITSINNKGVGEITTFLWTISNDCVFSIAGIYKPFVLDAGSISAALDGVITITSIESDGGIVDAGTDATLTADFVVAVSSIEDATLSDFDSLVAAGNASDFVVTISGIEFARIVNAVILPPDSNYVVTLGRIERAGVENAVCPSEPRRGSNYVVTLGRIERAGVVNAVVSAVPVRRPGANCVLTLGRIERVGVVNATNLPTFVTS
jgi:hypothetical protein